MAEHPVAAGQPGHAQGEPRVLAAVARLDDVLHLGAVRRDGRPGPDVLGRPAASKRCSIISHA